MASISKINNALLSIPNEVTVAAANFNLDFSLMKVEAPKEYHGVRDALSTHRRGEAEDGQSHVTARKLGALFQTIVPPIPHLIQAYGKRVSEISSRSMANADNSFSAGLFASQAGIDGTSIWAAATSGPGALAVHLLACMLARMWKSHEATSLWVEMVERRKEEIHRMCNSSGALEAASGLAARQTFSRQQLASWDASARAWLQTADVDQRFQQTQLRLIIDNVRIPVNLNKDPYVSILKAWTSGMTAMERLVQGIPQQVQDGAVLLVISSWHLYPNLEVLADREIKDIDQKDELMNGALVTIPTYGTDSQKDGVFWSLPLARMRYYSPPEVAESQLASKTSRVTMDELWIVTLGIILSQWKSSCGNTDQCCHLIMTISNFVDQSPTEIIWLKYLAQAAQTYTSSTGVDRRQCTKLLGLGMRWCASFLNEPAKEPDHFFGLGHLPMLLQTVTNTEEKIACMRRIAQTLGVTDKDLLIRYPIATFQYGFGFASAISSMPVPTHRSNDEPEAKRRCREPSGKHTRWIATEKVSSLVICDDYCCCVSPDGWTECPCAASQQECAPACHIGLTDLGALDQCTSRDNFLECGDHCQGQDKCRGCYLCSLRSTIVEGGEDCVFLQRGDVVQMDKYKFRFASANDSGVIYDFVLGDVDDVAIFKRDEAPVSRYRGTGYGSKATIDEIEAILASASIDKQALSAYLKEWWKRGVVSYTYNGYQQECSLKALAFATKLYQSLNGATISIETVKRPLYEAAWAQLVIDKVMPCPSPIAKAQQTGSVTHKGGLSGNIFNPMALGSPTQPFDEDDSHMTPSSGSQTSRLPSTNVSTDKIQFSRGTVSDGPQGKGQELQARIKNSIDRHLAVSFACIAMLESGEYNINPKSLAGVMALSTGDSIYVAGQLISDPSEERIELPIRRVFGNLGRPEMAFLVPPLKPRLTEYDLNSWHMINHLPFDGRFEDNFASTSLHLSFTDFEMPVDVGVRGLRDNLVVLLESLVSVNDGGQHLGDVDVMSALNHDDITIAAECPHLRRVTEGDEPAQHRFKDFISIDSWNEFFDLPDATGIVRATRNWQARLALTAASTQRRKKTLVLHQQSCPGCLLEWTTNSRFDVIII